MSEILLVIVALLAGIALWANLQPNKFLLMVMNLGRKASGLKYREVQVDDIRWPYLENNPDIDTAGKPTLVFVHGFAADKDSWSMYTRQFHKEYRIIAVDLPGHGESDKDLDRDYGIQVQTDRLAKFVKALNIEKCHMIGNSMGGHITLNFAVKYPELLDSIALINNAGVLMEDKTEVTLAIEAGENPLEMKSPEDVARQMALVMYKPAYIPGVLKKAMYQRAQQDKPILDKIFWTLVEQGADTALNEQLGNVTVPTCILWGRHGRIIDVSTVAVLEEHLANSSSEIIEEAGHVPMLEKPAETAEHHKAFLQTRSTA